MSIWDTYSARIEVHGGSKREASKLSESRQLAKHLPDSLSYKTVTIDGVQKNVMITNTDAANEKTMCLLPGEDLDCGNMVNWNNNYWIVVEKDSDNELYTKTKILQCNYLLKWVDESHVIREQWCAIEDGAKFLIGEQENGSFVVTHGVSRIAMTIAKNENTVKLGRKNRFIIDDDSSPEKLVYTLTKPLRVGGVYNNNGVFFFILQESVSTDDDNMQLGIADYYKHFSITDESEGVITSGNAESLTEPPLNPNTGERRNWL